jgi:hypothetical protein
MNADPIDRAWRGIVLDLFRAQEDYLRAMKSPDAGQAVMKSAWLRVQGAELRRDDFLLDSHAGRAIAEKMRA